MITYRVDKEKNILFVNMIGVMPKDKMSDSVNEFMQKCAELRDHFTIINDITLYKMGAETDFELLCKVTSAMRQKFVIDTVIRIVGPDKHYIKHLEKSDAKLGLKGIIYVTNRKEALDSFHKLNSDILE